MAGQLPAREARVRDGWIRRGTGRIGRVVGLAVLSATLAAPVASPPPAAAISSCFAGDYCGWLVFSPAGDGTGSITAGSSNEISCTYANTVTSPAPCQYEFAWPVSSGTVLQVQYQEIPGTGSWACYDPFSCISGTSGIFGQANVYGGQSTTITDSFWVRHFSITINATGTGSGHFAWGVQQVDCGAPCVLDLSGDQSYPLYAVPAAGSVFAGWTGLCAPQGTPCSFLATQDDTFSAIFNVASASASPSHKPKGSPKPTASPGATAVSTPGLPGSTDGASPSPAESAANASPASTPILGPGDTPAAAASGGSPILAIVLVGGGVILVIAAGWVFLSGRRRPN